MRRYCPGQIIFALFMSGFCAALFPVSLFAQSEIEFAKANQDYAQGRFKEAIGEYEAIVRSNRFSPNLFYNLGNAYFRAGDFGRAILNYERALVLDPHHPESAANVRVARDESRALELPQGWLEQRLQSGSVNQYSVAAAIAFWVALFCIVAAILARRRSAGVFLLSFLSLTVLAFAILAIYQSVNGTHGRTLAIVTGNKVTARLATADNSSSVLALPPGSEIKILSVRGDWVYVALPNNLRGWVQSKDAEQ